MGGVQANNSAAGGGSQTTRNNHQRGYSNIFGGISTIDQVNGFSR
jgi:hypothetical protein